MTNKIKNPYKEGYCEHCRYSKIEENGKLLCILPIINSVSDKFARCTEVKLCFSFQEDKEIKESNDE